MGRESRISSEQRWAQLTEALIELGRNVKILQARVEALESPLENTGSDTLQAEAERRCGEWRVDE